MAKRNKYQFDDWAAHYLSHECNCPVCNTHFRFSYADIKSEIVNGCYGGPYCFVTCPNCQSEVKENEWKYMGIRNSK